MDHGAAPSGGDLRIEFQGPTAWVGSEGIQCVFDAVPPGTAAIYPWTVPRHDGHLVFYVGE